MELVLARIHLGFGKLHHGVYPVSFVDSGLHHRDISISRHAHKVEGTQSNPNSLFKTNCPNSQNPYNFAHNLESPNTPYHKPSQSTTYRAPTPHPPSLSLTLLLLIIYTFLGYKDVQIIDLHPQNLHIDISWAWVKTLTPVFKLTKFIVNAPQEKFSKLPNSTTINIIYGMDLSWI